jgi:hypothetical protein
MELTQTILTPLKMKNIAVGYAKSFTSNYSFINFNSLKEAKHYVSTMYSNKNLFTIETDNKTSFLITPKF